VGIAGFVLVAPSTTNANVPLIYLINFGIATATAIFAPAELTSIPRIVDRRHLMAANSIFVLTINATFAIGFGFLGPLVLNVLGPIAVYVVVAVMFLAAALAILPLPAVRPDHEVASAASAAGRAVHELLDQLSEGVAFVRRHRTIAWSLAYLGISSSLIGVLGAIGPGFAVDILGLSSQNFFFIMGPAGLGAVVGILFLNSYGQDIPKRLVIDVGLIGMGVTLILLAIIKPVATAFGAATAPIEDVVPAIAPLISLIAVVVVIAVFAGLEYAFVAIPSQTALQEELPPDVRGRIFGILNTLLSVASFLPVILAPASADILNLFFEGAGIPIVMAALGILTLWAGIASWRRNARRGLHLVDRDPTRATASVHAATAPGIHDPRPEPPHRRRRRHHRPVADGD
jgi:MFS-type transporter involved in bile tolerance (Atg22 family)